MARIAVMTRMPRVLVVDDEPLIRWSLAETLAERGYEVYEAGTAADAMELVSRALEFQLVLLDLRLPDSSTLDLLERLRRCSPRSKFIMMTAYGTPTLAARCEDLGAGFIGKPFKLAEMVSAVEAIA